jgi:adenosylhomocysteine nucleosidase
MLSIEYFNSSQGHYSTMWQSILRNYLWSAVKSAATSSVRGEQANAQASQRSCDVGIVFALSQESNRLFDRLSGVSTTHGHGFVARDGRLNDRRIIIVEAGAGREAAARATDALIVAHRPKLVISAGFAGGLRDDIAKGHFVMADSVQSEAGQRLSIDLRLDRSAQPAIHVGPLITVDRIISSPAEKRSLHQQTGAIAVDMESFAVAETCQTLATPFLSVRIVSDTVTDKLPPEIGRLITKPTRVRQVGFALGAMLRRPSVAKDLVKLQQSALDLSDRLAKFLVELLNQIPPTATP